MKDNDQDFDIHAYLECQSARSEAVQSPHESCRDTARSWNDITGNHACIDVLKTFTTFHKAGYHILIHGHNRSGKTVMIHTALKAKFCVQRTPDLGPCNHCPNCIRWDSGYVSRDGGYQNQEGHEFFYIGIDGSNPLTYQEDRVTFYVDYQRPLVLYVDEVADPEFIKFMPRLIKPMTETPMTIIASGVRLRPRKLPVTGQRLAGLSKDFIYRFAAIEKTTSPDPTEFVSWLGRQAVRMGVDADEDALHLIIKECGSIPGQALRPLMKADLMKKRVDRAFVEAFNFEV